MPPGPRFFTVRGGVDVVVADEEEPSAEALQPWWAAQRTANPLLFDGPVVDVTAVERRRNGAVVHGRRSSYARYLAGRSGVPGCAPVRTLAVNALPVTRDRYAVLVRTASHSGGGGRLKFPGGVVEPGRDTRSPVGALERALARELTEEMGLTEEPAWAGPWTGILKADGGLVMLRRVQLPYLGNEVQASMAATRDPDREVTGCVLVPTAQRELERWLSGHERACLAYVPDALRMALGHCGPKPLGVSERGAAEIPALPASSPSW